MENLSNDLFNLDDESFVDKKTESQTDIQKFIPDASKQADKVYKAIIRFLPNWQDPNTKSKIKKHFIFLEDPVSGDKFSVDCPSTIGEKSILKDTYWKLKNSDSAKDQDLSKKFSRKTGYYSIIQVMDDKINPDNNGKVMYWNFGVKVNEKLEKALKPEVGTPMNPFNLLAAKPFLVDVCVKYDWNNYDACEFVGEAVPFELEGTPLKANKEDMEKVGAYLKENSPDLTRFEYKAWDDKVTRKVINVIKNSIPDGVLVEQIIGGNNDTKKESAPAETKEIAKEETPKEETKEEAAPEVRTEGIPEEKTSETAEPKTSAGNLDDLYKDL